MVMDRIPGFSLRVDSEGEVLGTDISQLGEWAYEYVPESLTQTQHHFTDAIFGPAFTATRTF